MSGMTSVEQRALAQTATADVCATAGEYLTFRLGDEEYGIDILKVQEIRGYERPTAIANAPGFIKGVINLRGVIVPIVDLRLQCGLQDVTYDSVTVTVILNVGGRTVGVVVDSVSDVVELARGQIKAPPAFNRQVDASFVTGLGTVESGSAERMLILVDIEQWMAGPDMGLFEAPATAH